MSARTPSVAVITDSTACLPAEHARQAGVVVVPLHVRVDGVTYSEGVDLAPGAVVEALRAGRPVTTSQPAPEAFAQAFAEVVTQGAREIVSVHLSGALSGTLRSAELAAQQAEVPVHVVDSGSVGMGLGFAALAAAAAAAAGRSAEECAGAARRCAASAEVVFTVGTLEHLHRGGRLSATQAALGTVLGLRPVLAVRAGAIEVVEKVRTTSRARDRLGRRALDHARRFPLVDVAVHHLAEEAAAAQHAAHLRAELGPTVRSVIVSEISAVVGAHVGPGVLAVVVAPSI